MNSLEVLPVQSPPRCRELRRCGDLSLIQTWSSADPRTVQIDGRSVRSAFQKGPYGESGLMGWSASAGCNAPVTLVSCRSGFCLARRSLSFLRRLMRCFSAHDSHLVCPGIAGWGQCLHLRALAFSSYPRWYCWGWAFWPSGSPVSGPQCCDGFGERACSLSSRSDFCLARWAAEFFLCFSAQAWHLPVLGREGLASAGVGERMVGAAPALAGFPGFLAVLASLQLVVFLSLGRLTPGPVVFPTLFGRLPGPQPLAVFIRWGIFSRG